MIVGSPITFEHLRIFVAVAERQHVTRAAEPINVTQSAASNAIAALEARHGISLFHRVELTEAGRMFLDEARAVLAHASAAERALAEYGELKRGTLRIPSRPFHALRRKERYRTHPAYAMTDLLKENQE